MLIQKTALPGGYLVRCLLLASALALPACDCLVTKKSASGRPRRGLGISASAATPTKPHKLEWSSPVVYQSVESAKNPSAMADRKRKIDLEDGSSKRRYARLCFHSPTYQGMLAGGKACSQQCACVCTSGKARMCAKSKMPNCVKKMTQMQVAGIRSFAFPFSFVACSASVLKPMPSTLAHFRGRSGIDCLVLSTLDYHRLEELHVSFGSC